MLTCAHTSEAVCCVHDMRVALLCMCGHMCLHLSFAGPSCVYTSRLQGKGDLLYCITCHLIPLTSYKILFKPALHSMNNIHVQCVSYHSQNLSHFSIEIYCDLSHKIYMYMYGLQVCEVKAAMANNCTLPAGSNLNTTQYCTIACEEC